MSYLQWRVAQRCSSLTSSVAYHTVSSSNPLQVELNNSSQSLKETDVINQLSDLLPIRRLTEASSQPSSSYGVTKENRILYLTPEEKLRGVFLQKLKGKFFIEKALTNTEAELNLDIVNSVLSEGNLGGQSMLSFFHWAIKQPNIPNSTDSYDVLLRALSKRKYVDFIERVLLDAKNNNIHFPPDTWRVVIGGLIRARRVKRAFALFENSEHFGFEQTTESLNVLLQCLCEGSHVSTASSYLSSSKRKVEPNAASYNIVIGGWANRGEIEKIEYLMGEMQLKGFPFDCSTHSHLIRGLGNAGKLEEAIEAFEKLNQTDTNASNSIIQALVSAGELDEAIGHFPTEPTMATFEILILGFLKSRRVFDALKLFDEMLERKLLPSTQTVDCFVNQLCGFGPPDGALSVYTKSRSAGTKISLKTYKALLRRLSILGKCGSISKMCSDMAEEGFPADAEVFEYIINGHCNDGDVARAADAMQTAVEKGFCPNKIVYSKLTNKLMSSGNVERAYKLYLKYRVARSKHNARMFWRANGWHF